MTEHLVDLHLHTTESDGHLTPEQLIDLLAKTHLEYVAITDHDTTSGTSRAKEYAKVFPRLQVIPGIEISSEIPEGEVHMLAYYINYHDEGFQRQLSKFKESRIGRAQKMIEKLGAMGMPLEWKRVRDIAKGESVGRPHVAQAMVEKGYVATIKEAFDKYISRDGPAYVAYQKYAPEEAIALAIHAGGLPVLAHPNFIGPLETLLPKLKEAGLVGMEVFYAGFDTEKEQHYGRLAKKYGLIPCGGSDYHAIGYDGEPKPGDWGPPVSSVEEMATLANSRAARKG